MNLPKAENWTLGTSERVIKRLEKLFDLYEQHAQFDDDGKQINPKAEEYYLEGLSLQDKLPVPDAKMLQYHSLF